MRIQSSMLALLSGLLVACGNAPDATIQPTTASLTTVGLTTATSASTPEQTAAPTATPQVAAVATQVVPPTALAAATSAPSLPTAESAQPVPTATSATFGEEVLFLRDGVLTALDVTSGSERTITNDVHAFAATPVGSRIAVIRGSGLGSNIWVVMRDGSDLVRLTDNDRAEHVVAWSPDGLTLAYDASGADQTTLHNWSSWSQSCATSEVRSIDLITQTEQTLARGCDPAFSPDGLRLAYAAAPTSEQPELAAVAVNSIRLINRKGENGWDFAKATNSEQSDRDGLVVHAPAWSYDAATVAYQRFIGYRALVDMSMSEIAGSFKGNGSPLVIGAGWQFAPQFSPDGTRVLVSEYNETDARGLTGYDVWSVSVVSLQGQREAAMPSGTITVQGQQETILRRAQYAAWSPDSRRVAVQVPAGWKPDLDQNNPFAPEATNGELWLWTPGDAPSERIASDVSYASPLAWLPAAARTQTGYNGYPLTYPADWSLLPATEFEELTAAPEEGGPTLISVAPVASDAIQNPLPEQLFTFFVAPGAKVGQLIRWTDGSLYRTFTGNDPQGVPIAGAIRVVQNPQGTYAVLYRTTPERWPLEQSMAQALMAQSGQ